MSARTEQRKGSFKKAIDAEDARRKRQETSADIRKGKREESLLKKRREGFQQEGSPVSDSSVTNQLSFYVALVKSVDLAKQIEGTHGIRKMLSIEKNPPINEVINTNILPNFIQSLSLFDQPKLQFEAAWALTNVVSGDTTQTKHVVDLGCIPPFVQLLGSPNEEVREQAIWAIGNIAGDGAYYRDILLAHNVVPMLLSAIVPTAQISLIRNGTWTLSNLCRGRPAPDFDKVRIALPLLGQLLQSSDEEVVTDACWAVSYLNDGPNDKIQSIIDAGITAFLVKLLEHPCPQVHTPALRAVGNIVTGDEAQTQALLQFNPLPKIRALLESTRKGIRKEACWTISNITAGSKAQIQAVIDTNLAPLLISHLATGDFDVKREACWAITNATTGGSPQQIAYLVQQGCIKPLCDVLVSSDIKVVSIALESLENILRSGRQLSTKAGELNKVASSNADHFTCFPTSGQKNCGAPFGEVNSVVSILALRHCSFEKFLVDKLAKYADLIEEADGVDKISDLQSHKNDEIYKKAVQILEDYFNAEEVENQNSNQNAFNFGGSSAQITFSF